MNSFDVIGRKETGVVSSAYGLRLFVNEMNKIIEQIEYDMARNGAIMTDDFKIMSIRMVMNNMKESMLKGAIPCWCSKEEAEIYRKNIAVMCETTEGVSIAFVLKKINLDFEGITRKGDTNDFADVTTTNMYNWSISSRKKAEEFEKNL